MNVQPAVWCMRLSKYQAVSYMKNHQTSHGLNEVWVNQLQGSTKTAWGFQEINKNNKTILLVSPRSHSKSLVSELRHITFQNTSVHNELWISTVKVIFVMKNPNLSSDTQPPECLLSSAAIITTDHAGNHKRPGLATEMDYHHGYMYSIIP